MADKKIKMAVNWACACGGCDVSILDTEEKVLELAQIADIIYWPCAMDFKHEDLRGYADDSIDICLFNGSVRTSEQEEEAMLLRKKSKVLVAYGACACFGGVPGLANVADRESIFETVYGETASTDNPEHKLPLTETKIGDTVLTLPEFFDTVKPVDRVVDVDYYIPGCPPVYDRILDLIQIVKDYAEGCELPEKGAVVAHEKALCEECRLTDTHEKWKRITKFYRPHEIEIDPEKCFLDQGLLCMGPATRGGCGEKCINVNMPCRGCMGPTEAMTDQGIHALSAIGSIIGEGDDRLPKDLIIQVVEELRDPLGLFNMYSLPSAIINRALKKKEV